MTASQQVQLGQKERVWVILQSFAIDILDLHLLCHCQALLILNSVLPPPKEGGNMPKCAHVRAASASRCDNRQREPTMQSGACLHATVLTALRDAHAKPATWRPLGVLQSKCSIKRASASCHFRVEHSMFKAWPLFN